MTVRVGRVALWALLAAGCTVSDREIRASRVPCTSDVDCRPDERCGPSALCEFAAGQPASGGEPDAGGPAEDAPPGTEGEGDVPAEGEGDGAPAGEGEGEGAHAGEGEGEGEGAPAGEGEGEGEGEGPPAEGEGEGEGPPAEGEGEGEGEPCAPTSPPDEVCDGVDNDCNGLRDDVDGVGAPCEAGVGACETAGRLMCGEGALRCDAEVPSPPSDSDLCGNGIDDDCDGGTDDAGDHPLLGQGCRAGVGACRQEGVYVCAAGEARCDAQAGPAGEELCGNGLDDDCDGDVDEGLDCVGCDGVEAPAGYVCVEAGAFQMGSPAGELGRLADRETRHPVEITRPFLLKAREVTQGEWRAVFGSNPSGFVGCGEDCPVESVNWYDVLEYGNRLSDAAGLDRCYRLDGCNGNVPGNATECGGVEVLAPGGNPYLCEGFRLPTEAEWEYAYRAGTATAFYNGGISDTGCNDPNMDAIGWYCGNADGATHPVARKAPNAWGLYDMAGNVWEWVWDVHRMDYEALGVPDPVSNGGASSVRLLRGGSWDYSADHARAARRDGDAPGARRVIYGFRVARSAP